MDATSDAHRGGHPVRFSIVSAVYNVERYLDDFIASIEAQTFPLDDVEVLVVDDGSTDDSLARLREWEARRPELVRVFTKDNSGQSAARNMGLEHVRGEWVTFTDPDDLLSPKYLKRVARFIDNNPQVQLVVTRQLSLDDETGEVSDSHPLRRHFSDRDSLRDLDRQGDYFTGSAATSFFRTRILREGEITFDHEVRPVFEDGHFCARYLLAVERPLAGFVRSAQYTYRRRHDGTSSLQRAFYDPDRYTRVLRHGYLPVLEEAVEKRGVVPDWLQSKVIYDLSWYFSTQEHVAGFASAARGEVAEEFHTLMAKICQYLSAEVLGLPTVRPLRRVWRDILLHSYRPDPWHSEEGAITAVDTARQMVCVSYHFTGEQPDEVFLVGGHQTQPLHAKIRDVSYHERVLIHERLLWFPSTRSLRIQIDGRDLPLVAQRARAPQRTMRAWMMEEIAESAAGNQLPPASMPQPASSGRRVIRLARTALVRRRYAGAWVLLDRIHNADDSAERLFSYLRSDRREINAWFVIEKGTADWKRLRRKYGRRVVAHGSLRWKLMMLNCQQLVSSHVDDAVVFPPEVMELTRPPWRLTFLDHGVIKDDLSVWLNRKPIEVFVTSTPQEYESIAGDHTPYVFTSKETVLTGLPRFDRLREIGNRVSTDQRDLILVVPTWRRWLIAPLEKGSQRRTMLDGFFESEFMQQWMALLGSPELEAACEDNGVRIGFLPHPNLQPVLAEMSLPGHVEPLSYEGNDVQEYFARAAVMVTDYSSVAFNAAYIDRPVVYFQFDADRMFGGDHVGQGGYFQYDRDGFGPVSADVESAVGDVIALLKNGKKPFPEYAERIDRTFTLRDGKCCERVTDAILESSRPARADAMAKGQR